jgi:hypothetical protein
MPIRNWVIEQLTPLLPKSWKLIPYSTNLDRLSQPVVMLQLQSLSRTPSAPNSGHTVEFTLTVIEPNTDPAQREDLLDDKLDDLVYAIETIPNVTWTKAERAMFADSYLAFDITLEIVTKKDKESA